jgi:branched-chain amino acid transport system substrate-binding protein
VQRIAALALVLALFPLTGVAQTREPYKIGLTIPLTGAFASSSAEFLTAAQVAAAQINSAGGVKGHPLQIVAEDSQGNPQAGLAAMRKLVQVDGVQALISFFTNVVTAQIPLADELKVPLIAPVETPGLVTKGVYAFAHSPTLAGSGPLLQAYWKAVGIKRIAAIYGDNAFGHLIAPRLQSYVTAAGAAYNETFIDLGASDFRGPLARLKEYNPDAIYISAQGTSAETATIKQIRELGFTVPIFNGSNFFDNNDYHAAIGPYSEGMFFVGFSLDKAAAAGFIQAFRAKSGADPGAQQGEIADMVRIYAWAIGRAGYNGEAIRNQIASLKGEVPSLMGGTIAMGADHYSLTAGMGMWQVKAGREVKAIPPHHT